MPDIVISEFMDEESVAALAQTYATHYDPALVDKPEELRALLTAARAVIVRNRTQVRGALLAAAPRLAVIGRLGVGLDNIDVDACRSRNIEVCPATGCNDVSVAEYVIATALLLLRGAYQATARVAAGQWPRNALIGREMSGRRMGIVGFGAIGRETARRARALGMRVAAHDPWVRADDPVWGSLDVENADLDQILEHSDVVSLHVPLVEATRHLLDRAAISRMQPGAILINAARGGIVDEAAVAEALRDERLGGAALDVFEEEPLGAARGALFAGCRNVILTPHIAGVTQESNVRASSITAANVRRVLELRP